MNLCIKLFWCPWSIEVQLSVHLIETLALKNEVFRFNLKSQWNLNKRKKIDQYMLICVLIYDEFVIFFQLHCIFDNSFGIFIWQFSKHITKRFDGLLAEDVIFFLLMFYFIINCKTVFLIWSECYQINSNRNNNNNIPSHYAHQVHNASAHKQATKVTCDLHKIQERIDPTRHTIGFSFLCVVMLGFLEI